METWSITQHKAPLWKVGPWTHVTGRETKAQMGGLCPPRLGDGSQDGKPWLRPWVWAHFRGGWFFISPPACGKRGSSVFLCLVHFLSYRAPQGQEGARSEVGTHTGANICPPQATRPETLTLGPNTPDSANGSITSSYQTPKLPTTYALGGSNTIKIFPPNLNWLRSKVTSFIGI